MQGDVAIARLRTEAIMYGFQEKQVWLYGFNQKSGEYYMCIAKVGSCEDCMHTINVTLRISNDGM